MLIFIVSNRAMRLIVELEKAGLPVPETIEGNTVTQERPAMSEVGATSGSVVYLSICRQTQ